MTAPASPPAARQPLPSWLDFRLVAGVLLVLISVLTGARVVASADQTTRVWAVDTDLAAGTVLTQDDLRPARVRLVDNADRYLPVGEAPVGRTLTRDLGRGELVPRAALTAKPCGSEVSIPVTTQHVPASLRKGFRIDVFATDKKEQGGTTMQVLHAVTVQAVLKPTSGFLSANAEWSIVVRVPEDAAGAVFQAVRTADIDIAIVDGAAANDGCGAASPNATAGQPVPDTPGGTTPPGPTAQPSPTVRR
ncbi:MAG TPA: SAF domain-containing protein [Cryptosporangiaceae bacterium]|nr:SAF domain-containing protein [Cryptosporangiaceae bacterium]